MKRFLFFGAVAFLMGTAANAQIVKSSSNQTIITTKTQVTQVIEQTRYNRIYLGYASTKIKTKWDGGSQKSDPFQGFNLGWTIGRNVTKNKLPIFIETGLDLATGWCDNEYYDGAIADFELPVNVTYRYRIGQSKVRIAPYFGFHLKFNACYGEEVADKVCRFGLQLGANFDINHFY
ncbi:MAG: outer membrane beta-barrel protein, partial [Bacteroidaceae bacterium]|nr:outer membrane beta-barrel protein [Bacteroidaceae bacterium]